MAEITIKGKTANTSGYLPKVGDKAPDFVLTKTDFSDIALKNLKGKNVILNIFPSIDTPVCSASVRRFNAEVVNIPNTVVLCVSKDLPFAHARFCEAEGISGIIPASELFGSNFGEDYGVRIIDGQLRGLFARAVVVLNDKGNVIYSKFVNELGEEPDYKEVLSVFMKKKIKPAPIKDQYPLNNCTSAANAESARSDDLDEPCDDGRGGK